MLAKLADLLILQPTRDPIDPEERQRRWIETESGGVEAWTLKSSWPSPTFRSAAPILAWT